mmetsp:Transcript_16191/g.54246  ORF Transcript_16191/g.54246 Transcript_16191/m.54246 type:complete len:215 (-) Transcript_16191:322-966(-)
MADHPRAVFHALDNVWVVLDVQVRASDVRDLLVVSALAAGGLVGQVEHEDPNDALSVSRIEDGEAEVSEEELPRQLSERILGGLRVLHHLIEDVPVLMALKPNRSRKRLPAAEASFPPHPFKLDQHCFTLAEAARSMAGPSMARGGLCERDTREAAVVGSLGLVVKQMHHRTSRVLSMRLPVVHVAIFTPQVRMSISRQSSFKLLVDRHLNRAL